MRRTGRPRSVVIGGVVVAVLCLLVLFPYAAFISKTWSSPAPHDVDYEAVARVGLVTRARVMKMFRDELAELPAFREARPHGAGHVKLIVTISSARDHFAQRERLRASWIRFARENDASVENILIRFFVASRPCMIEPQLRLNAYECIEGSAEERAPDVIGDPKNPVFWREQYADRMLAYDNVEARLKDEAETYGDIVFPTMTDSYRGTGLKFLRMVQWASQHDFDFLLKCDDDTLIITQSLLPALAQLRPRESVLWSNLRRDYTPHRDDHNGKWYEPEYAATRFPTFGCGANLVLSKDLVVWMNENASVLKIYQGDDVSIGIWLTARQATLVHDGRFSDEITSGCRDDAFSNTGLSLEEFDAVGRNLRECGRVCECKG